MSTDLILCPIDGCDHQVDATAPSVPAGALASVFGPGVMAATAAAQHARRVEDELARHLGKHSVTEFVATITKLRRELEGVDMFGGPTHPAFIEVQAERDEARAEVERLRVAAERIKLARGALVETGYFTAWQVSDDVAPRITELHSALSNDLDQARLELKAAHIALRQVGDYTGQVEAERDLLGRQHQALLNLCANAEATGRLIYHGQINQLLITDPGDVA